MGVNFKEKTKTNKKLGNLAYFWRAVSRPLETEKNNSNKKQKTTKNNLGYIQIYIYLTEKLPFGFPESILLQ